MASSVPRRSGSADGHRTTEEQRSCHPSASRASSMTTDPVDPHGPVFVSYRQSDGTELAVALAWLLRAAGVPVWHDQTDLPPGDTDSRLQAALADGLSGGVLVVTREIEHSSVVRDIELQQL